MSSAAMAELMSKTDRPAVVQGAGRGVTASGAGVVQRASPLASMKRQ
jgi:hypothetical protein